MLPWHADWSTPTSFSSTTIPSGSQPATSWGPTSKAASLLYSTLSPSLISSTFHQPIQLFPSLIYPRHNHHWHQTCCRQHLCSSSRWSQRVESGTWSPSSKSEVLTSTAMMSFGRLKLCSIHNGGCTASKLSFQSNFLHHNHTNSILLISAGSFQNQDIRWHWTAVLMFWLVPICTVDYNRTPDIGCGGQIQTETILSGFAPLSGENLSS